MSEGMNIVTLKRTHKRTDGCFGVLDFNGKPFCVTVENAKLHIPKGEYFCQKTWFNRGGYKTFEVMNVPGRDRILFHRGNIDLDSQGCILVAEKFGLIEGRTAVLDSKDGFSEFYNLTNGSETFKLVIEEV